MGDLVQFRKPELLEISRPTMEELARDCLPLKSLAVLIFLVEEIPDLTKKELEILSGARKMSLKTDKALVSIVSKCLETILDKRN